MSYAWVSCSPPPSSLYLMTLSLMSSSSSAIRWPFLWRFRVRISKTSTKRDRRTTSTHGSDVSYEQIDLTKGKFEPAVTKFRGHLSDRQFIHTDSIQFFCVHWHVPTWLEYQEHFTVSQKIIFDEGNIDPHAQVSSSKCVINRSILSLGMWYKW